MKHQRGAALLLAMIIVALVATLATAMVWQQWRAIQVESAERARAQSAWTLVGAKDWARLILREDNPTVDSLNEPWALPLKEARLSTFLASDKENTDEMPDAFLSGAIIDAQSRYNLRNLANGTTPNEISEEQGLFVRMMRNVGIDDSNLETRIIQAMRASFPATLATAPPGASAPAPSASSAAIVYLQPQRLDQLAWFGIDKDTIERMRPYFIILPPSPETRINLNTTSRELLAAVLLDSGMAQMVTQRRQSAPFVDLATFQGSVPMNPVQLASASKHLAIASNYFEVRGRLRIGERVLEEVSIVRRNTDRTVTTIQRRRESLRDLPG